MSAENSSIRMARYSEFDTVCDILADSFFDDPVLALTFPNPQNRWAGIRTFFELTCSTAREAGTIAFSTDGQGVVVYERPSQPSASTAQPDLDALMLSNCAEAGEAAVEFVRALDANHPRHVPHYYLFAVGVRRGFRGLPGQGLIGHVVAESERERLPCYAETTSQFNRRLGHRFGYSDYGSPIKLSTGALLYPLWRGGPRDQTSPSTTAVEAN
ncbi:hypothetical protein AB3X91_19370 [Paraburkholderia sp. BR14263]|uniref:hypothetical protein n=1 Tax=unclassified Paraburkholderia TaxID=2615204 RepID=UPI0034CF50BB